MQFIIAQTDSATPAGGGSSLIFLAVMFALFYFLFIRPQRKRARQQQDLQSEITTGDDVQTIGGIRGKVISTEEETLLLELAEGRMWVARRAISGRLNTDTDES